MFYVFPSLWCCRLVTFVCLLGASDSDIRGSGKLARRIEEEQIKCEYFERMEKLWKDEISEQRVQWRVEEGMKGDQVTA